MTKTTDRYFNNLDRLATERFLADCRKSNRSASETQAMRDALINAIWDVPRRVESPQ